MTPFALRNADCRFKLKNLDESALEMEGGHKRRVVEAVIAVHVIANRDAVIKALEWFYTFLRQSCSLAMREGDEGGAWEHRAIKKIPAQTLSIGARPAEGKELRPVFVFSVASLKGPVVFKGGRDGNCSARFTFEVRITAEQAEKLPTWVGTDMACHIEQTQVTVAELEKRKKEGEDVEKLVDPDAKKKKPKKEKGEQLTLADAQAKQEHAAGIAQVNAAIDGAAPISDDDAEILHELIALVATEIAPACDGVPVEVIKTWTTKDRELVTEWASAVHAKAEEIPEAPEVIEAFGAEWNAAAAAAPPSEKEQEQEQPPPGPALALVKSDDMPTEPIAEEEDGDDDDDDEAEEDDPEAA